MSYQSITIVGNLGKDPDMKYSPDGKAVTNFSVATSFGKDKTTWFKVAVWGAQAESCNQYLQKGSKVLVTGYLQSGENGGPKVWTAKDGSVGASFEISANTVRFLSRAEENTEYAEAAPVAPDEDDEIPF
jgi:single-strand DNA-binding protein